MQPTLAHSLRVQSRVVGALLVRESLTRYGRHNLGFLWMFLEPMLFTIGVTALWIAMRATHVSTLPIVAFALTGYSSVLLWRSMPTRCLSALEANKALLHHRNVRVMDLYITRILLEALGVTMSFMLLTTLFWATDLLALPEDVLTVAAGWSLLAWFGGALGIVLGCLGERSELVDRLWHPFSYLMFPLSGAAFMVDWLPPSAREVILLFPMVHCTEMIRAGYLGASLRTHYDAGYVVVCCLALTLIGSALLRDTTRRVGVE
ncbi:MAG: ABC transporter permease [Lautropia sp.]